jgi:hypothetical protein
MSQDDGVVYSTRQIADSLGLGSAMVRKWALALEKVTGQEIRVKRRDGRQFSRWDFETISAAKGLVDTNKGLSIEAALRMVLGGSEEGQKALAAPQPSIDTRALGEALTVAISRGNEPLLAELRQLRQDFNASQNQKQLEVAKESTAQEAQQHGLLVRLAMWVERRLWRHRGE